MFLLQTVFVMSGVLTVTRAFSLSDVQHTSQRLSGSDFTVEKVKNFLQCKTLCDSRPLCKSFNYNTVTRECVSNAGDSTTPTATLISGVPGEVFVEKRSPPQSADQCRCEKTQACVLLSANTTKCLTEKIDCGEPPDVRNSTRNTTGTTLNSVTSYSCSEGYEILDGSTTSTCEVTRRWTSNNLICVVSCGNRTVDNGHVVCNSTVVGSVGSVTCDEFFRFFGTNSSVTCMSTGKWVGYGQCKRVEWTNETVRGQQDFRVPSPLSRDWEMHLKAKTDQGSSEFAVNLQGGADIFMHFKVKFKSDKYPPNQVFFDTSFNDKWINSINASSFPLGPGKTFTLNITLQVNTFKVAVEGYHCYNYTVPNKNVIVERAINSTVVHGNMTVQSLFFKY